MIVCMQPILWARKVTNEQSVDEIDSFFIFRNHLEIVEHVIWNCSIVGQTCCICNLEIYKKLTWRKAKGTFPTKFSPTNKLINLAIIGFGI
jgi:hypothetical protein